MEDSLFTPVLSSLKAIFGGMWQYIEYLLKVIFVKPTGGLYDVNLIHLAPPSFRLSVTLNKKLKVLINWAISLDIIAGSSTFETA
jgi:hypothetical protein